MRAFLESGKKTGALYQFVLTWNGKKKKQQTKQRILTGSRRNRRGGNKWVIFPNQTD